MTTRLAVIFVLLGVLFVAVSCMAQQTQPASAQAVTPLPGPQATATAAAQRLNDAQAQTAAADATLNQAIANKQQIDDTYRKAQVEFANAQANLQAQQYQQAGEAIGRGNAYIETGQAQANQLFSVVTQQKSVIEAQAAQIISVTNEAQLLRVSLQTTNAAYTAQQAQIEADKGKGDVGSYAVLFAFIMCAILLVSLVLVVLQRRREPAAPPDPPIDSEWRQAPLDADRAEDNAINSQ